MRALKLDENLRAEVGTVLRTHGLNAATVLGQRLRGRPDWYVINVCQSEGRAIITLDRGFLDSAAFPPLLYSGTIVLRPVTQSTSHILELVLHRLIPTLKMRDPSGSLWVVEMSGVTIK